MQTFSLIFISKPHRDIWQSYSILTFLLRVLNNVAPSRFCGLAQIWNIKCIFSIFSIWDGTLKGGLRTAIKRQVQTHLYHKSVYLQRGRILSWPANLLQMNFLLFNLVLCILWYSFRKGAKCHIGLQQLPTMACLNEVVTLFVIKQKNFNRFSFDRTLVTTKAKTRCMATIRLPLLKVYS